MSDEILTVPPRVGDLGSEDVTLEAELVDEDAERNVRYSEIRMLVGCPGL
jgi:hypothetical protein